MKREKPQVWMRIYATTHRPDGHRVRMNRSIPWPPGAFPGVPVVSDVSFHLHILRAVVSRPDRGLWFKGDLIHWIYPIGKGSALFEQTCYNGAEVIYQLIVDGMIAASATIDQLGISECCVEEGRER